MPSMKIRLTCDSDLSFKEPGHKKSKKKCGRDLNLGLAFSVSDFDSVTGVDEQDVFLNQAMGLYDSPVLVIGQP